MRYPLVLVVKLNLSTVCWALCMCIGLYRKRDTYLQRGKALLKEGKKSEAFDCFQKCVDVSPEMALAFIKVTCTVCTPMTCPVVNSVSPSPGVS